MWNNCGMARTDASLREALATHPASCARSSGRTCACSASNESINQSLERAGRVADFLELAELICLDAWHRTESCGGHFRDESQTEDGEALRDDDALRLRRRPGSTPATASRRCCARSRSSSTTCTWRTRSYK